MNNSYYETLDENFNEALNLIDKPLAHKELIDMLKNGNIVQRQLAAIRLETLNSPEEAETLLDNLVGQDGKIREAVSIKIKDFSKNENIRTMFQQINNDKLTNYILSAIIDINGNICRNILDSLIYFKEDNIFSKTFIPKLTNLIHNLLEKIKTFNFTDSKYKTNKEIFKLYWSLEAACLYYDKIPIEELKDIIKVTKDIDEYTIREKTAKILSHDFDDENLKNVKKILKNDKNYYVRRF